ncbi:iron chelate uptake ABC transporter family permease subunit [Pseudooceanicola sp.]|uniref:iron chelate uptake ABC transporter family permease subunit n=1 Tax=Pseudooceanicola sp. TaxID=1914328 RepID=UPI00405886ED
MPSRALILAGAVYAASALAFLTLGARGDWGFLLLFRGEKLLALSTVGAAVALSTLVFQTITGNRILTPAIMGFDALYVMIQTALVFLLGGVGFASLGALPVFALETALMVAAATGLFTFVMGRGDDMNRLVLTGIVFGILLRSLSALMARMIDPSEYAYVQAASYARFTNVDGELLWIAVAVVLAVGALVLAQARRLDVLALGRATALTLGVAHDRAARRLMWLVTLLVAVSTALVGPIVFFGLLVSAVTYQIAGTWRHAVLLPLSALIAAALLVASQTLFERVLSLQSSVFVVIEALGGLVFLYLVLRRAPR